MYHYAFFVCQVQLHCDKMKCCLMNGCVQLDFPRSNSFNGMNQTNISQYYSNHNLFTRRINYTTVYSNYQLAC